MKEQQQEVEGRMRRREEKGRGRGEGGGRAVGNKVCRVKKITPMLMSRSGRASTTFDLIFLACV